MEYIIPNQCFELSFESRDRLKDLPKRVFPNYSFEMQKSIALSMIDILFSYLYDLRTTNAEHTVESGKQFALFLLINLNFILFFFNLTIASFYILY